MATSFFVVSDVVSVLWLLQLVAMDKHSADTIIICLILIVLFF